MSDAPILYTELAEWWPLMSAPADYAEEAAFYAAALREHSRLVPRSLLELGSGGGNNASHMKAGFDDVTLSDLSPGMLVRSRELNPECEHVVGDMRSLRLGREYDCVFVHDAVCYMTSIEDLDRVAETAFLHCKPGGAVLLAPDHVRENFAARTDHGGHDGEGRSLRYLEWVWDPDPTDHTYCVDYAYVLRDRDGTVTVRHDRHLEGLFAAADWTGSLERAGFIAQALPFDHSDVEGELMVFVGAKP